MAGNSFFDTNNDLLISPSLKDKLDLENLDDSKQIKKGLELKQDYSLKFIVNLSKIIELPVLKLKFCSTFLKVKVPNRNLSIIELIGEKNKDFAFYLKQNTTEKLFDLKLEKLTFSENFLIFTFLYDT